MSARSRPLLEWLVVGGATLFLYPLAFALRRVVGLDAAELAAGFFTFHLAYVLNDPHFCVTYLLFYRDARSRALDPAVPIAQRARIVAAGVLFPVVLATWAGIALATKSAQGLGWMIQLMFLLVGWHYVKQGFGVLTVLSARRGVVWSARERTVLLAHAYAGWAFAWANPSMPAGEFEEKGVVYWAPPHPRWLELGAGSVLAATTLAVLVVLARRVRARGVREIALGPLSAFLVSVWAWSIFSAIDPVVRYLVPALHSVQYLYFVWLMRRNEAKAAEGPPSFGRPAAVRVGMLAAGALLLGWILLRWAPSFLDAALVPRTKRGMVPDALGETPYFAAFYAFVNLHHYAMDAVIWRRDNPDTKWLRDAPAAREAPARAPAEDDVARAA